MHSELYYFVSIKSTTGEDKSREECLLLALQKGGVHREKSRAEAIHWFEIHVDIYACPISAFRISTEITSVWIHSVS